MDARGILEGLKQLCRDYDDGRPLRRVALGRALCPLVAPAAIGVAMSLSACEEPIMLYDAPPTAENCETEWDDDGDGLFNCDDPDCEDHEACMVTPDYAAPFEELCDDDADDDGDGLVDCDDPDCESFVDCSAMPEYGASFEECSDGIDNDMDGFVDCADRDCDDDAACADGALYAVPF